MDRDSYLIMIGKTSLLLSEAKEERDHYKAALEEICVRFNEAQSIASKALSKYDTPQQQEK